MTSQFPDFSDFFDGPNPDVQVDLDSLIQDHPCMESIFRKVVTEAVPGGPGCTVRDGHTIHDVLGWTKFLDLMVDLSGDSIQDCAVEWMDDLISKYTGDGGDMSFILSPASFLDIAHFVKIMVQTIKSLPLNNSQQFIELHFYKILGASFAAMNTSFRVRGCSQWFGNLRPDSEDYVSVKDEIAVIEFLRHVDEADILFSLDLLITLQRNEMDWVSELSEADLDGSGLAAPGIPIRRGVLEFIQKYRDVPFDWAIILFQNEKRNGS